jgi:hypothetical protein
MAQEKQQGFRKAPERARILPSEKPVDKKYQTARREPGEYRDVRR